MEDTVEVHYVIHKSVTQMVCVDAPDQDAARRKALAGEWVVSAERESGERDWFLGDPDRVAGEVLAEDPFLTELRR